MLITHEELKKINGVQTDILKNVAKACEIIGIKFFMVHGSLLGTIRNHGFVPDDDDIDIAFFRDDYEKFISEAPKYLDEKYFVQSIITDKNYPMEFAKVRDSSTTYVIDVARNIDMNHGIYIDVFPIDYVSVGGKLDKIIHKLLDLRISSVFNINKESVKRKIVRYFSCVVFPDLDNAIQLREQMNVGKAISENIKITGGKLKERIMPVKWFVEFKEESFDGIKVFVPSGYDNYLTHIYGDYTKRTLVENKISDEENIEINACVVDTEKSYLEYNY